MQQFYSISANHSISYHNLNKKNLEVKLITKVANDFTIK